MTTLNNSQLDVLFVHVPRRNCYYPALNIHNSCNRMALGLPALANFISKTGYSTKLLHLGIEERIDKKFSFAAYLQEHRPKLIGFSQHFHHNIVDVLQSASLAKKILPDCFIVLGGFTATFFAHDIIERAPFVDAVCKGDAELPLIELSEKFIDGQSRDLIGLPNLVWRKDGVLQDNEQSYSITQDIFDQLDFANFSLLEHAQEYIKMPKAPVRTNIPGSFDKLFNSLTKKDKQGICWGLSVGRGCVYNCCYCGGSNIAQKKINNRSGIIFRSQDKVIASIRKLMDFGFKGAYVSFDPSPQWSEEYYSELFRQLREAGLSFSLLFSAWRLPTEKFFDAFAKTFDQCSAVLISPETGSDAIRKISRPNCFTNAELLDRISYADRLGVRTNIFFSIGALERKQADLEQTLFLKQQIQALSKLTSVEGFLVEAEPGAPWQMNPEQYGIKLLRQDFNDFIRDHSAAVYSSMTHLGYTTALFGDQYIAPEEFYQRLLQFRCANFCNMVKQCAVMKRIWQTTSAVGLTPKPEARHIEGFKYTP